MNNIIKKSFFNEIEKNSSLISNILRPVATPLKRATRNYLGRPNSETKKSIRSAFSNIEAPALIGVGGLAYGGIKQPSSI